MMTVKIGDIELNIPQHDKLDELSGENNVVAEFLEWLKTKYTLAEWEESEDEAGYFVDVLYPVYPRTEDLLAEYYEIDLDAFWKEKEAMLAAYRKQQEAVNALDN